ncbi:hypothetical protein EGW08_020744 [Elysia chlorotica]|uniref:Uncharacterized protein n=1 Tax=Elysia chlorotica TaxID=188477 RepID=A0A433SQH9_ELYCH|nr:hypothetical protein EGW08_020744 [Elysia chlorotica]
MTEPACCLELVKSVLNKQLFSNSFIKSIRINSAHQVAQLCNSNRRTILTKTPVKDLLRDANVVTNVPFIASVQPVSEVDYKRHKYHRRYKYQLVGNVSAMDEPYVRASPLKELKEHVEKKSSNTFNAYLKGYMKYRDRSQLRYLKKGQRFPVTTMNEIIVPNMPIYTLIVDIDAKDLVNVFYPRTDNEEKFEQTTQPQLDSWLVRERIHRALKDVMTEYLTLFPLHEDNSIECALFESIPESLKIQPSKVGLHAVYKFSHLVFLNSEVAASFLRGFDFFLFRKEKSVGGTIDFGVYPSNLSPHQLRLTLNSKNSIVPVGEYYVGGDSDPLIMSRPLLPLCESMSKTYIKPSCSLVHLEHRLLAENREDIVVLTDVGDVTDLATKFSPLDAEFNLLKKRSGTHRRSRKRRSNKDLNLEAFAEAAKSNNALRILPEVDDDAIESVPIETTASDYSDFFQSIFRMELVPAIINHGGGGVENDLLTKMYAVIRQSAVRYCFPRIPWCVRRQHVNPYGNLCRYFINIIDGGRNFTMDCMCFSDRCGYTKNVYAGKLPQESDF